MAMMFKKLMFSKFRSDFRLSAYVRYYQVMKYLGVLILILSFGLYCFSGKTNPMTASDHIARIDVGYVSEQGGNWISDVREAFNNPRAKGIILVIDQASSASSDLFDIESGLNQVRNIKGKKPIVGFIYGHALGGTYVLATETDYIVSQRTATLGGLSIAVSSFDAKPLMDKIGVELVTKGYGDLKVQPDKKDKNYDAYIKHRSAIYQDLYQWMLDTVAQNRSLSKQDLSKISSGEWYLGDRALAYGLCDSVGDLTMAADKIRSKLGLSQDIIVVDYSHQLALQLSMDDKLSYFTQAFRQSYSTLIREITAGIYQSLMKEYSRSLRYVLYM